MNVALPLGGQSFLFFAICHLYPPSNTSIGNLFVNGMFPARFMMKYIAIVSKPGVGV